MRTYQPSLTNHNPPGPPPVLPCCTEPLLWETYLCTIVLSFPAVQPTLGKSRIHHLLLSPSWVLGMLPHHPPSRSLLGLVKLSGTFKNTVHVSEVTEGDSSGDEHALVSPHWQDRACALQHGTPTAVLLCLKLFDHQGSLHSPLVRPEVKQEPPSPLVVYFTSQREQNYLIFAASLSSCEPLPYFKLTGTVCWEVKRKEALAHSQWLRGANSKPQILHWREMVLVRPQEFPAAFRSYFVV